MPQSLDSRKAWWGVRYVSAICLQAGFVFQESPPQSDVFSLDGQIFIRPSLSVFVQVKCTSKPIVRLRPDQVSREFDAHTSQCELPQINLHDMRHGACSLMLSGGVPVEVVQMILRHSSPAVTRRVYAHLLRGATAEQVEAATAALDAVRRAPSTDLTPDSQRRGED